MSKTLTWGARSCTVVGFSSNDNLVGSSGSDRSDKTSKALAVERYKFIRGWLTLVCCLARQSARCLMQLSSECARTGKEWVFVYLYLTMVLNYAWCIRTISSRQLFIESASRCSFAITIHNHWIRTHDLSDIWGRRGVECVLQNKIWHSIHIFYR